MKKEKKEKFIESYICSGGNYIQKPESDGLTEDEIKRLQGDAETAKAIDGRLEKQVKRELAFAALEACRRLRAILADDTVAAKEAVTAAKEVLSRVDFLKSDIKPSDEDEKDINILFGEEYL